MSYRHRDDGRGDAVVSGTRGIGLNLRAQPSTHAAVLRVMPEGTLVHVTGGANAGFYPVTYTGWAGWASGAYLAPAAAPHGGRLQAEIAQLAAEVGAQSPGTDLALAVRDLDVLTS
jgi:uncharacterized protein YgiM (DUF1202 family)